MILTVARNGTVTGLRGPIPEFILGFLSPAARLITSPLEVTQATIPCMCFKGISRLSQRVATPANSGAVRELV